MSPSATSKSKRKRWELAAAGVFVLANLVVPLVSEDFFPFTTTPMFRDKPRYYSNYIVYDPRDETDRPLAGEALEKMLVDLELQRTYDGNPAGLGVGRKPLPTLDRFTETLAGQPGEDEVRWHVAERLRKMPEVEAIDVAQEIVGPLESGQVGVVRRQRWRIEREATAP